MNDLDLRKEGRSLAIPSGDVDAVVGRGATLARRRHRAIAGGMAVILAASAVSYMALTRDGKPTRVLIGDGPTTEIRRGDAGIRWEKVPVRSGLTWTNNRSEGLYAVSTAPGRGDPNNPDMRPVLWHSADGVEWADVRALGDLYLGDLADRGARLYGVGTGPASAAVAGKKPVSDLVVGWSDNGGRDWARRNLPVDVRAMAAKTRRIGVGQVEVAATDQAVVAVASFIGELDVPALLPDGQTAPNGWVTTDNGVDVLGDGPECPAGTSSTPPDERGSKPRRQETNNEPPGEQYSYECFKADGTAESVSPQDSRGVKASYTWEQLGVNDDLRRAVRNEPFVFVAAAGTTDFTPATVPALSGKLGNALLDTNGDGLLLVVNERGDLKSRGEPKSVVLRSTDGRTWSAAPTPPGFQYALGLGRLGQRTALLGGGAGGATMWLANPDGTWSPSSLAGAVDPEASKDARVELVGADVGPLGVVAVVSVVRDHIAEKGGVKVTQNGYTLTVLNDHWSMVVTDPAGKEIGRTESVGGRDDGPIRMRNDGSVAVLDDAGKTLVAFNAASMRAPFEDMKDGRDSMPTFRVVATRDGATWSDEPLQDLAGSDKVSTVNSVIVSGERAVVSAMLANNDPKAIPKQVALVGTPR
jgi:hypothetical protein